MYVKWRPFCHLSVSICLHLVAISVHIQGPNFVITVSADDLAPSCVRSSAGTVMTTKWEMSSSEFFCLSMTSYFCWPALVQVMAWHQTGTKPLPEPMMTQFNDVYLTYISPSDLGASTLRRICRRTCSLSRDRFVAWWRHQMETFSALLALCAGNSPVTGQFPSQRSMSRGLVFSLICAWTNGWVNNRHAGDLGRNRAHYDVTVMVWQVDETEDRLIIISIETGALCDQPTTKSIWIINLAKALWWPHNERDSVSNHQSHDCLPNRLFSRRSKKTSKLRVTGLCVGNSPGTG